MNKKVLATSLAVAVLTLGLSMPAFAQQQGQQGNNGFFGMLGHFFSRFFSQGGQNQGQNANPGEPNPTGISPSGTEPNSQQIVGNRLQGFVNADKITQAQKQQILTEITKIQTEIKDWSVSTGIDQGYVYQGLRGQGMDSGIGGPQEMPVTTPFQNPPRGGFNQGGNPGFQGGSGGLPNGKGVMPPQPNQHQ